MFHWEDAWSVCSLNNLVSTTEREKVFFVAYAVCNRYMFLKLLTRGRVEGIRDGNYRAAIDDLYKIENGVKGYRV